MSKVKLPSFSTSFENNDKQSPVLYSKVSTVNFDDNKLIEIQIESKKRGKWTKEEDEVLENIVLEYGQKNWKKVSEYVKGRSPIQCLHRWTKILKPGLIKGPWTIDQDKKLIEWVKNEGPVQWSQCAEFIKGRSGKQCRERWFNTLNPEVKKGNWSPEEDFLIFDSFRLFGSKWTKIAERLPGRTENSIKNRFYSTLRRISSWKKNEKTIGNLPLGYSASLNKLLEFLPLAIHEKTVNYLKFQEEKKKSTEVICNMKIFPNSSERNAFGENVDEGYFSSDVGNNKIQGILNINDNLTSIGQKLNILKKEMIPEQKKVKERENIIGQKCLTNCPQQYNFVQNPNIFQLGNYLQEIPNHNLIDEYQDIKQFPIEELEKDIDNLCDLNPFSDPNIAFLDNQINDFIDNYFDYKNDNPANSLCEGCQDVNSDPERNVKKEPESGSMLNSLLEQLDELEAILQNTKEEIVKKMRKVKS